MKIDKDIIKILSSGELRSIFDEIGAEHVYLFGSFSRGDQNEQSDIDLLYKQKKGMRVGGIKFLKNKRILEERLGKKIDLVEESAVNKNLFEYIQREKKIIF